MAMNVSIDKPLESQMSSMRRLWKEAFGDSDEFLDIFFQTAYSPDRCRVITTDDTPTNVVAALYWFDCTHMDNPVAYIYAVATAKAFRGQGLCHKLMDETHCQLKALGYKGAILVPGNAKLFSLYEAMGYEMCSSVDTFQCECSTATTNIEIIPTDVYAKLRRQMLPDTAVLQEGENLDFLQHQATFYTGDGFLLAARREDNSLYGIEFLGNKDKAPDILKSLGYQAGTFRTLGYSSPFAMYLPLKDGASMPAYFGLAFD